MEQNSDVYMHSHSSPDRIDDTDQHAVSSYDHTEAPSRQHHDSDSSDSDDGSEGNAALLSQNDETWDTSDVISDVFDQRVRVLAATLESVESKCILLSSKLTASEEQAVSHMNRWVETCIRGCARHTSLVTCQVPFLDLEHVAEGCSAQWLIWLSCISDMQRTTSRMIHFTQ